MPRGVYNRKKKNHQSKVVTMQPPEQVPDPQDLVDFGVVIELAADIRSRLENLKTSDSVQVETMITQIDSIIKIATPYALQIKEAA